MFGRLLPVVGAEGKPSHQQAQQHQRYVTPVSPSNQQPGDSPDWLRPMQYQDHRVPEGTAEGPSIHPYFASMAGEAPEDYSMGAMQLRKASWCLEEEEGKEEVQDKEEGGGFQRDTLWPQSECSLKHEQWLGVPPATAGEAEDERKHWMGAPLATAEGEQEQWLGDLSWGHCLGEAGQRDWSAGSIREVGDAMLHSSSFGKPKRHQRQKAAGGGLLSLATIATAATDDDDDDPPPQLGDRGLLQPQRGGDFGDAAEGPFPQRHDALTMQEEQQLGQHGQHGQLVAGSWPVLLDDDAGPQMQAYEQDAGQQVYEEDAGQLGGSDGGLGVLRALPPQGEEVRGGMLPQEGVEEDDSGDDQFGCRKKLSFEDEPDQQARQGQGQQQRQHLLDNSPLPADPQLRCIGSGDSGGANLNAVSGRHILGDATSLILPPLPSPTALGGDEVHGGQQPVVAAPLRIRRLISLSAPPILRTLKRRSSLCFTGDGCDDGGGLYGKVHGRGRGVAEAAGGQALAPGDAADQENTAAGPTPIAAGSGSGACVKASGGNQQLKPAGLLSAEAAITGDGCMLAVSGGTGQLGSFSVAAAQPEVAAEVEAEPAVKEVEGGLALPAEPAKELAAGVQLKPSSSRVKHQGGRSGKRVRFESPVAPPRAQLLSRTQQQTGGRGGNDAAWQEAHLPAQAEVQQPVQGPGSHCRRADGMWEEDYRLLGEDSDQILDPIKASQYDAADDGGHMPPLTLCAYLGATGSFHLGIGDAMLEATGRGAAGSGSGRGPCSAAPGPSGREAAGPGSTHGPNLQAPDTAGREGAGPGSRYGPQSPVPGDISKTLPPCWRPCSYPRLRQLLTWRSIPRPPTSAAAATVACTSASGLKETTLLQRLMFPLVGEGVRLLQGGGSGGGGGGGCSRGGSGGGGRRSGGIFPTGANTTDAVGAARSRILDLSDAAAQGSGGLGPASLPSVGFTRSQLDAAEVLGQVGCVRPRFLSPTIPGVPYHHLRVASETIS